MDKDVQTLLSKWRRFLGAILEPATLLLLLVVWILYRSASNVGSAAIPSLLFVVITVTSAILGGRIVKVWVDISEGGVLVARGKGAVRGLKLLLRNIAALESRVTKFLKSEDDNGEVIKRNYEEIVEICALLQEEAVNSIENWTDIVPEADIKTHIGVISDLRTSLDSARTDLEALNKKLEATKGESAQERKKLVTDIEAERRRILELQREIARKNIDFSSISSASVILNPYSSSIGETLVLDEDSLSRLTELKETGGIFGATPKKKE